jgi:hypothetical protein
VLDYGTAQGGVGAGMSKPNNGTINNNGNSHTAQICLIPYHGSVENFLYYTNSNKVSVTQGVNGTDSN